MKSCNSANVAQDTGGSKGAVGSKVAGGGVVTLGIRRLCKDERDVRLKLRRILVSRDRRIVLAAGSATISTSVVTILEFLFGVLPIADFALLSKLAMIAVAMIRQ